MKKIDIMTQIIQLITKSFDGVPHVQKDRKRSLMEIIYYDTDTIPKPGKDLLDRIPYGVPNYMKDNKSRKVLQIRGQLTIPSLYKNITHTNIYVQC